MVLSLRKHIYSISTCFQVVLREHVRAHHSGTESRLSANCYECIVCGQMFGSSSELCLHLVHHSDENTAKHRLPNPTQRKVPSSRKKQYQPPPPPPPPPPTFKAEPLSDLSDNSHDSEDFSKTSPFTNNNKRIKQEIPDHR